MKIVRGKMQKAKKIVIYGPEGIGKTSFAAQFPDPVFIDTEGGTKDMDVARFEKATSWTMLLEQTKYVISHPDTCKTLVIDTADWAEQLEIESLCAEKSWDGLEGAGYGKGYTYSAERFGTFLNLLSDVTEQGIHVVMAAHAQLRKVELPEETGAYDHWEMKTSKKVAPMIREWADAVFFANYKTLVVEIDGKKKAQGGHRVMYTSHTPFWDAKNRYGLPEELPLNYGAIRSIIELAPAPLTMNEPESKKEEATKERPRPSKSGKKPKKETAPEAPAANPAVSASEDHTPPGDEIPETGKAAPPPEPDKRILKALRDLMIESHVGEWDLQMVVDARQPGVFPIDMQVKDYPQDFVDGWILPNWGKIVEYAKDIEKNGEIPFN